MIASVSPFHSIIHATEGIPRCLNSFRHKDSSDFPINSRLVVSTATDTAFSHNDIINDQHSVSQQLFLPPLFSTTTSSIISIPYHSNRSYHRFFHNDIINDQHSVSQQSFPPPLFLTTTSSIISIPYHSNCSYDHFFHNDIVNDQHSVSQQLFLPPLFPTTTSSMISIPYHSSRSYNRSLHESRHSLFALHSMQAQSLSFPAPRPLLSPLRSRRRSWPAGTNTLIYRSGSTTTPSRWDLGESLSSAALHAVAFFLCWTDSTGCSKFVLAGSCSISPSKATASNDNKIVLGRVARISIQNQRCCVTTTARFSLPVQAHYASTPFFTISQWPLVHEEANRAIVPSAEPHF